MTVSEDDIARQQIEEDLRLYGSRPEPPDIVEVDEATQLANLPPKRNASEFEAAVDRPAKMRKKGESKEFNYQALTVMDWNSGASPLDAWLNQSAVPSTTEALNQPGSMKPDNDLLAQEMEEIKVFRNVHVATAPSMERNDPPLECIEGLDFDAQIYYRNIIDRYPVIPIYLARRLAQANHDRAERLREMKGAQPKLSFNHDVSPPHWSEPSASNAPGGSTHQQMKPEMSDNPIRAMIASQINGSGTQNPSHNQVLEVPNSSTEQPSYFFAPFGASGSFSATAQMRPEIPTSGRATANTYQLMTVDTEEDPVQVPIDTIAASNARFRKRQEKKRRKNAENLHQTINLHPTQLPNSASHEFIQPMRRPSSDFWTGGSQSSRPASAHSRSSSMNSSLHGRPAFDPQEQNPTFVFKYPAPTACDTIRSPALPPPPVDLGTVTTFDCDICGQNVQVARRLEWQ